MALDTVTALIGRGTSAEVATYEVPAGKILIFSANSGKAATMHIGGAPWPLTPGTGQSPFETGKLAAKAGQVISAGASPEVNENFSINGILIDV